MENELFYRIIFLNELHEDPYCVVCDIIKDYKLYNFNDMNECKHYVINIIEDKYDLHIDEQILLNYLKTEKLYIDRTPQEEFRNKLIEKYKSCVVTGNDPDECEACHIISLNDSYNFDIDNGLLLSSSLHTTFDKHIWSINDDCKIVVKNDNKVYLIKDYDGMKLTLNENTRTNLKKHYEIYKQKNFQND